MFKKMSFFITIALLAIPSKVWARSGIDSGGADYMAQVSCYLEDRTKGDWLSIDVKNFFESAADDFPGNTALKSGAISAFPHVSRTGSASASISSTSEAVKYRAENQFVLSVKRTAMTAPWRFITISEEISSLYQGRIHEASLDRPGGAMKGFCVRNTEFYLALEFAPLRH